MRNCPVCENPLIRNIFSMSYKIPDGWPLPSKIDWNECVKCGMIYGDGDFNQAMLDEYYTKYYGYGVNNPENMERLKRDAEMITEKCTYSDIIVDFGGAGDDGHSVLVDALHESGFMGARCVGPNDALPYPSDVIYASHVLEHVYDLPQTMERINGALAPDGLLIIDVPDATGILQRWKMPILDFNTKHINHFTLRNLLDLGHHHGFELVDLRPYEMQFAPIIQAHFKRLDVARMSEAHIAEHRTNRLYRLGRITKPVNVWGLGDITWHLLSQVDLNVLDYIDNDPAYRGQTYNGKPVQERPTNAAPIVIMAQGQRQRLIENIRKAGIKNVIIEV